MDESFTAKLQRLRTDAGLSQKQLALAVGISQQRVSQYENGTARFPVDELAEPYAEAMNVSAAELVPENIRRLVESASPCQAASAG